MKPIIYFRISIFILLLSISYTVFAKKKIIRYKNFEREYKKNSNLKTLSKHFNLRYILLLDTTYKKEFFRYDAELKKDYASSSAGLKKQKGRVVFSTKLKNISRVFNSKRLKKRIIGLNCGKCKIKHPIYIKGNTAIVKIIGDDFSGVYYFYLENGKMKQKVLSLCVISALPGVVIK